MALHINNSLIPGYRPNGTKYTNDIVKNYLNGGGIYDGANLLGDDPSGQEAYKLDWAKRNIGGETPPTVPDEPVVVNGETIWPWDPRHPINRTKGLIGANTGQNWWDPIAAGGVPDAKLLNYQTNVGGTLAGQNGYQNFLGLGGVSTSGTTTPAKVEGLDEAREFQESNLFAPKVEGLNEAEVTKFSEILKDPDIDPRSKEIGSEIYDQLLNVLKTGKGLPGTEVAVSEMREVMAAFTKDVQAKAGLETARGGGIGQATQFGAANRASLNVMQQLAKTERGIAGLRAEDARNVLSMGRDVFESDRDFAEAKRVFDENLKLQKDQFEEIKSSGAMNRLERLSGDNPILLSKLIDVEMGKEGIEFTPDEQQELADYYEKKAKRQERLDEADITLLERLPDILEKQINDYFKPTTEETLDVKVTSDVLGLDAEGNTIEGFEFSMDTIQGWSDDNWKAAKDNPDVWSELIKQVPKGTLSTYQTPGDLLKAGFSADEMEYVHRTMSGAGYTKDTIERESEFGDKEAGSGEGSIIMISGVPYRIVKLRRIFNEKAFPDERYTTVTYENLLTGETVEKRHEG